MKNILGVVAVLLCGISFSQCCEEGEFECQNGYCVPGRWECDGDNDCGDLSDEHPENPDLCPACSPGQYRCANGLCIPSAYVCDGDNDCRDMSDEPENPEMCPACDIDQYRCNATGHCIPDTYVCNERNDCGDNSDEFDDPEQCPACNEGELRCSTGRCLGSGYICDGYNDCTDWGDESEELCPCADDENRCSAAPGPPGTPMPPGQCIPAEFWCDEDGIWDCVDGSDERNCTLTRSKIHKVKTMEFKQMSRSARKQGRDH